MTFTKKEMSDYLSQLGRKGGKARAQALTKEERRAISQRGAEARWKKAKKGEKDEAQSS